MTQEAAKRTALFVATVSTFVTPLMASAVNIALPSIGQDLHADTMLLSWVASAYALATAVGLLPAGRLADLHGRKRIFATGMSVFAVGCLGATLAPDIWWLLISRVVQGLGSSFIFATGIAIITSIFPPGERGKAMGITAAAVYIGLAAGPFLGGILTSTLGWRSVFLLMIPLSILCIYLLLTFIKGEWAEAAGEPFDWAGALFYALALIAFMQGMTRLPSTLGWVLAGAGFLGLAGVAFWLTRHPHPLFRVQLFVGNRVFALSSLAAFLNYAATFAVSFLMSLHLQNVGALSPQAAGSVLMVQPILQALVSPLAGRLSDRLQPRLVASAGMAITALGLVGLAFMDSFPNSTAWIMVCLAVMGLGFGLFSSPNMNAIMSSVEKRHYSLASASLATMRILGQMFSLGLATCILAAYIGPVNLGPQHAEPLGRAVALTFGIMACLCLLGIAASAARGQMESTADNT